MFHHLAANGLGVTSTSLSVAKTESSLYDWNHKTLAVKTEVNTFSAPQYVILVDELHQNAHST